MYTLNQIAKKIGGEIDPRHENIKIQGISSLEHAGEGDLTFISSDKMLEKCQNLSASAIIIQKEWSEKISIPQIIVKHAYIGFAQVLSLFEKERFSYRGEIHPSAVIGCDVILEDNVTIGPKAVIESGVKILKNTVVGAGCYIGRDVQIGENSIIYPNVSIYADCKLGNEAIVHSGTVIGSDGYGFTFHNGKHLKIPQIGGVIIGNEVEIGANVTIDRGTIHPTIIGNGTKIDNLVHIAHNVQIGEHCLIVAQVGVSGSVEIGDRVTLAGQVGIVGHLKIGNDTIVAARSVVMNNIEGKTMVSGFPAIEHKDQMRIMAAMKKLPEMLKQHNKNKKRDR